MELDTGASVSDISESTYNTVLKDTVPLESTDISLRPAPETSTVIQRGVRNSQRRGSSNTCSTQYTTSLFQT